MRVRVLVVALLLPLFLLAGSFVLFAFAQDSLPLRVKQPTPKADLPAYAADQIIVKFKPGVPASVAEQLKTEHGAKEIRASKFGGFVTLSLPEGSNVYEKAEIFNKNPLIEYAHPNFFVHTNFVPNDTLYYYQWHFDDDSTNNPGGASSNPFGGVNGGGIRMEEAWDISTGSASVVVAILDSGVAYERFSDPNPAGCYDRFGQIKKCLGPTIDEYYQAPDLVNTNFSILTGSDLVNNDDHPNDDDSHGTHVAGTVAQSTNNSDGVAGVAFNTTVMPIKVLDANGGGLLDIVADGILFAINNGADVISMSLGGTANAQVMEDAVASAFSSGVVVVAAAGNSFQDGNPIEYPAGYDDYVIAVGATRYDETRSYYSNTGPQIDVTAPGGDVTVNQNEDTGCGNGCGDGILQQTFSTNSPSDFGYFFFQGTSMSAPHVSALAALILSVDSSLSPTEVRNVIESTAEDKGAAGRDDIYGHGIIDAFAALSSLVPSVSISLTTDGTTPFEILALGATQDTTSSGTDDVQTIQVTTGPADLLVKSTSFTDGVNTWILDTANGADQVLWEFSKDGTTWPDFSSAGASFPFDTDVAQNATRDLYLKLTMPTSTSSSYEHSATVTIVATAP